MMAQPAARCQPRHPEDPESRGPGGPKPEQLYGCSSPTHSPGQKSSEIRLRKPAESLARSPKSPTPGRPEPEQFPKTPGIAVPSPRTVRTRTINQLLVIFSYILCLMLNNVYIWCYVDHARLG